LLEGKFPKELEEIITRKGKGLFPTPDEIHFSCSCPDWAYMCKHVAATLYGIGTRLDESPLLFFKLRNVRVEDLILEAVEERTKGLLEKADRKSGRIINDADLSGLFGIEMDDAAAIEFKKAEPPKTTSKSKQPSRKKRTETGKKAAVPLKARKSPARKDETAKKEIAPQKRGFIQAGTYTIARKPSVKKAESPKKEPRKVSKPPVKKAEIAKKDSVPRKIQKTPGKKKMTDMDTVFELIRKAAKGVDFPTITRKTGLDDKKVFDILFELLSEDRICRTSGGYRKK